jgi:hypothetical protein
MPSDFYIDVPQRVVFSSATGVVVSGDVLDHMERLRSDPNFIPEFNQILDLRAVTKFQIPSEDIRGFAKRNVFAPTSKRSFLVASESLFGVARMFDTYRKMEGEQGIKIVSDMDQARSWVGLSKEQ